jgi:hypothetical protein
MSQQLTGFDSIWGAVTNDCIEVGNWLEGIENAFALSIVGIPAAPSSPVQEFKSNYSLRSFGRRPTT